jgi:formate dehydrogenase major subunit
MTNHWIDLKNSDCILIMGSNAAENHPISFKYVTMAQQSGGKVISVDPRFTRTSSKADIYAPLRSGTDIAFLGGMIKYILDNKLYNEEYVVNYTNATFLVNKDYVFKDGLFSGFDPQKKSYNKSTWTMDNDENGVPKRDLTLKDPRCVFNVLKDHYSRYDLKLVSRITGTSEADLMEVYKTYSATGAKGKAGTIMYAMGWTQHTVGVQNIRTMSIIQSLLANMGVAGGGVNALRGESNVQGSTDQALLWHIWPGYTNIPKASQTSLETFLASIKPASKDPLSVNWKQNYPKYAVSMLKSFFGENATKDNEFGYQLLPKPDDGKSYSWLDIFDEMYKGSIKGFFAWGMNPACSSSNAGKARKALAKLDWMVNVNIFDNETGSFWKGPGMKPSNIKTEVFMLPAAVSVEKEGSVTNSGRWMQWRYEGPKPLGNSKSDGDIIIELGNMLKEAYKKEGGQFPDAILKLKWDYMTDGKYDPHKIAKEINGYFLENATVNNQEFKKGDLVPSFVFLQGDGKTSSGNWIYSGSYTGKGNMSARKSQKDVASGIGLYPEFAWAWPVNRRIIYNRAAVDLAGRPNDEKRWVVKYTFDQKDGKYVPGKWEGDVPDGPAPPLQNPDGTPRADGKHPFIMQKDGFAAIFGPGLADGPFPEHYEPMECPVEKNFMSAQLVNPTAPVYGTDADTFASCDPRFPYVGTTYRVSEHWQTGLLTRPQAWLLELQPQVFVEMSEELAKLKSIKNGERVKVSSVRGSVECTAVVTKRFKPFKIGDSIVHEVGMPYNYGWRWPVSGKEESPNLLTPSTGDPNTRIPETKAFMVNISKIKRG